MLVISLQFGETQLLITERIFKYLEDDFDVSFHVDAIKVNPFGEFEIHNVLIKDHHQDTLIFAEDAKGRLVDLHKLKNKVLSFADVKVSNGGVNDIIYPGEESGSLTIFSSKFGKKKSNKKPLEIKFKEALVSNLGYSLTKNNEYVVDFNKVSGHLKTLVINGPEVEVLTDSLSFEDVYKIKYQKLETDFKYSLSEMSFNKTHILTDHSDLYLDVVFNYTPSDFSDFVSKVNLKGAVHRGEVSLEDIDKIYPHFDSYEKLGISSKVNGTLNNLRLTNAKMVSRNESLILEGDLFLKNSIDNRDDLRFRIKNGNVNLVPEYLKKIVPNLYNKSLPDDYIGINKLNFLGDLEVSLQKLIVKGTAKTNIGNVELDGFINKLDTPDKNLEVWVSNGFVPELNQIKGLKNIKFKGKIKGNISQKNLDVNAKLDFKNLTYKKIKLSKSNIDFQIDKNSFIADFESKDTLLTFKTKITQNKINKKEEYNFDLDVTKARINDLFPEGNYYQKNVTGSGRLKLINKPNEFSLDGLISGLYVETPKDSLNLSDMRVSLQSKGKNKNILIESKDILSMEGEGEFNFEDLKVLAENALYKFIPGTLIRSEIANQTLVFKMQVYPTIVKVFTDQFWLDKNLIMSGVLDAKGDKGAIYAKVPTISSKDLKVENLEVTLDNSNQWINSNISIQKFKFKKQVYEDLSLLGKKVNDTLFVRSNFQSDKINNRAVFYLTTEDKLVSLGIESVYFKYLKSLWVNLENKQNKIRYNYETGDWAFHEISFANGEQEFEFDGTVKKDHSKNLKLTLNNINLAENLPSVDSLNIGGIASGEVFFKEKNTLLKPNGSLKVEKLRINGIDYGNMVTSIDPNDKKLGYNLNFNITNNDTQNIDAIGEIIVNENNFGDSKINLKGTLNNLRLGSLSPLGRNVLSAIRGKAKGDFTISGSLNDFNNYGTIELKDAGLKFPYLNVDYNFVGDTKIKIDGKKFIFDKILLKDVIYGTNGTLDGEINYDKYNNWNLDLKIDSKNLLVLNTEQEEDSKYYGTAFMDGFATIVGPTTDLAINVSGTTLPNTKFVLPISDIKQVESNRFIYFKESETDEDSEIVNTGTIGGITVTLNLDITKDALGEVVIDQASGSSLQGRTDGRLLIDIDKLFNIRMYGDLVVDEGLYNFRYGGFVNKPFVVKKGGTVSWNGDPFKAELNIEAIHHVKANPKVLLESLTVNRKIDVDLITKVTGELFNSNQEFIITIPNASSTVSSELDFKLNIDENSKMRQFFSLLVTKNFYDENNINNTSSVITNTTSEIISNAVTQIFNKEEDKFHINFGYTSGEASNVEDLAIDDQIDIGVATEINDRVLINGKLGVPVGTKTQTAVVGEVKIEFLINKDGSLRSSVFNRQNEIQYSEEEQGYTQGIGLSYQIDFNNLTEMLQKIGLKEKKKEKIKKEEEFEITDDKLFYILPDLL
ncbi:translocation/assembly module TamB domain-containing protein [Wenyingzhuangia marina]|uniref:translocation/assembly module TamB domain-containing protein n=1 Tax=Wenyingzhuangia marina TaxID=1195760 RepID=UPI0011601F44|nr:translocation/assembly module TamB domain-containing protein [Wenyingzhuangia marina]